MINAFLLALSALWTTVVIDVIVEAASSKATQLSLFGRDVSSPTSTGAEIVIVSALAASAAFAVSAALASWNHRRLERRMATEVDERWEAVSREQADAATRTDLEEWRTTDLQNSLDMLLTKRDELLAEIATIQNRTTPTPTLAVVPDLDEDRRSDVARQPSRH
ncbi:MAG: hypothetical protein ABI828_02635 [Actinomycetota bacterium]